MAATTPAPPVSVCVVRKQEDEKGDKRALMGRLGTLSDVHGWVQTQHDGLKGRFVIPTSQQEAFERAVEDAWGGKGEVVVVEGGGDLSNIDMSAPPKIENHSKNVEGKDDWSGGKQGKALSEHLSVAVSSLSAGNFSPNDVFRAMRGVDYVDVTFTNGTTKRFAARPNSRFVDIIGTIPPGGLFTVQGDDGTFFGGGMFPNDFRDHMHSDGAIHLFANFSLVEPPPQPPSLRRDLPADDMPLEEFAKLVDLDEEDVGEIRRAKVNFRILKALALRGEQALESNLKETPGLSQGARLCIVQYFFPPGVGL